MPGALRKWAESVPAKPLEMRETWGEISSAPRKPRAQTAPDAVTGTIIPQEPLLDAP